jgi:hypothetical protein
MIHAGWSLPGTPVIPSFYGTSTAVAYIRFPFFIHAVNESFGVSAEACQNAVTQTFP